MNTDLQSRLESYRCDFAALMGAPFQHFFCPFLFRDEEAILCKGHVLNQAFGVATNAWGVQRQDVDNFFGSHFEAAYTNLRYRDSLDTLDVLGNPTLKRALRTRIFAGDREVDFFIPNGEVPARFTVLHSSDSSLPPLLGLKLNASELDAAIDAEWFIETELDLRVTSFVSLLKAAHLTLFFQLGYRYVLSTGGRLVGHDLLGKLFVECKDATPAKAQRFAADNLEDCVAMVAPLLSSEVGLRGTLLDGQLLVAWSGSGFPWAMIVVVPAGESLHGVMLPVGDHAESIATWYGFMGNSNDSILVSLARFEPELEGGVWRFSKETWRIRWPKGGSFSGPREED